MRYDRPTMFPCFKGVLPRLHERRTRLTPATGSVMLLLALSVPCTAASLQDASRISRVTVYPGSATIERVLTLAAGTRQAQFACLPSSLDAASLQVSADTNMQLGEISVEQRRRDQLGEGCRSPLNQQITDLQDQSAQFQAESDAIALTMDYLKGLTRQDLLETLPSPEQMSTTARSLEAEMQEASLRQHGIQRQQEALQAQLAPLLEEQARQGKDDENVSVVSVRVDAPEGGTLSLRYSVAGPSWTPAYRARLDTASASLQLERLAEIHQATGEDWLAARLTLSTSTPGRQGQAPLPRPWRLDIGPLDPPTASLSRSKSVADSAQGEPVMEAVAAAAPMPDFAVTIAEGAHAAEFTLPAPVDVASGGNTVTLPLEQRDLSVDLLARTTPASQPRAWLTALVADLEGHWPDGPVALFRDGQFIGKGQLQLQQIRDLGLAFGVDDQIAVQVRRPEEIRGKRGIIGKRNERTDQREYQITNHHRQNVTVQVLDAAPIAENKAIQLESSYAPAVSSEEWMGQRGTIAWELEIAPGDSQTLKASHRISWPEDERLRETH